MKGYIYKITNLLNWKCYIGQTVRDPEIRWKQHISDSRSGGNCIKLYRALRKYDLCYFSFEVIAEVNRTNEEELHSILDSLEKEFIKHYDSVRWGYNIEEGGNGHSTRRYLYLECDREGNLLEVWKSTEKLVAANYKREPENWCSRYTQVLDNWERQIIEDNF